jgi:hypothetical protein
MHGSVPRAPPYVDRERNGAVEWWAKGRLVDFEAYPSAVTWPASSGGQLARQQMDLETRLPA